jgi:ATP-binding cassette subfamily B protein
VVSVALAMAGPRLVGMAIDGGIPPARAGDYLPLLRTGALLAAVAVLAGLVTAVGRRRVGQVGQAMVYDLRRDVNGAFQRLPIAYHERWSSGVIISRLTADVNTISDLLGVALNEALSSLLTCLGLVVAMLSLDLPLAGMVLACVVPGGLLAVWFARRLTPVRGAERDAIADTTARVVETLGGIRAVQAYRSEHVHAALFRTAAGALRRIGLRVAALNAVFWPVLELSLGLAAVAVVLVGGYRVIGGSMQIGALAAFVIYVGMFFGPLASAPYVLDAVQTAAAATRKIAELLAGDDSVPEPSRPVPLPVPVRGEIAFEGVDFGYRPGTKPEIQGLSLVLRPGEVVAMLGTTGAGKSTVAKLIARFYDPSAGRVTLDGVDLRELSEADLRGAVVLSTQETFLFSGSIADNIRLGRPRASRDEVEAAARAVGADALITGLPDGYDTDVRQRGARLSAGERQLIAFARAFLADPAVVILDEATASLDIPTERALQKALHRLLAGRAALIIAHRLSTLDITDRVLVLEDGHIVDDAPPAELLARSNGAFTALYRDARGLPTPPNEARKGVRGTLGWGGER